MTTKPVETPAASVSAFTETLKIALYGQFGSRKTLQIGSLVELVGAENVMVISAERGLGTVRTAVEKAVVVPVTNLDEMRAAFLPAMNFAKESINRWVVIDGMSQATEWLANEQLSGAERYYDTKVRGLTIASKDLPFGRFLTDKGAIDTMRIYGRIGRDSENLLSAWIGLPCNLYVNYLEEKTGTSGYDKTLPYGPDVPGRVGLRAVMSSFDFVGRLFYDAEGRLVAGFDSRTNQYLARTREDRTVVEVPSVIVDFKLGEFVKLVKGTKDGEQARGKEA